MHQRFARTSNVTAFWDAFNRLQSRGAEEASWLLAIGLPGFGKTRCVHNFAVATKAVYLRAKVNWRPQWMLREMATELGLEGEGGTQSLFGRVIAKLAELEVGLVIDEARNMLHDGRLLETLRDISDTSGCTVVLSGEEFVLQRLTSRYPQIRSRISEIVAFRPAALADVRACCDALSEIKVADDLVAEIHKQSRGFYREIKNAIAAAERVGQRNDAELIELRHVAGLRLCQDRNDARTKAAAEA